MKFGDFVKHRRIEAGLTLRSFCREVGFDPSNWSKIERGVIPPPQDQETLDRIARLVGCDAAGKEEMRDLAAAARGQLPPDFQDEAILAKLPAFFRAIRGQEFNTEDIEILSKAVRKLHQP